MKKFKKVLASAFFLTMSSTVVFAQAKVDISNLNAQIAPDKSIRIGKLPNGLTYYIKKNTKPESRMELRLAVRTGAINEDADQNGLAHFSEHMLFNGTKNFEKNEIVHYLERIGVRFGADLNAYTYFDRTVYMIPMPSDKPEIIHEGFKILADWAGNALFQAEEIDKERGVIREELRLRQGAQMRAQKAHKSAMFYGSKMEQHDIIGDTNIIMKAPYEAFTRYYKEWYRPDLMAVIAVGDFDVDAIEKQIKENFAYLQPVKNPRTIGDEVKIKANKEPLISVYKDKEQTINLVQMFWKHQATPEGTIGSYREKLMHGLVGIMFTGRLSELLQSANPPFQFAQAGYDDFLLDMASFQAVAALKEDDMLGGYETLLKELIRATKGGFTDTELDRAKKTLLAQYETMYNERDKAESGTLADEYIRNFLDNEPIPGIEGDYAYAKQLTETMSINDVNSLVKKYITPENFVLTLTAADKEGAKIPSASELLATYKKVSESKVEAYKDVVIDKPLFDKKLTSGTIKSTKELKEVGVTEFTLSNGAKVIVKPTDFQADQIMMSAYSFGGTSLVPEKDHYNALFAAQIIDNAGISDFDTPTLTKLLSGKNVNVSPYLSDYEEGFNGESTVNDFETMLQLLHLYFSNPRKDTESFASWKLRVAQQIDASKRNPQSALNDTIRFAMSNYDKRKMPQTKDMINAVDLEKAFEIYKSRFADAGDFTFVFVGNVDMPKFKDMITKYIASLPSKNSTEKYNKVFNAAPKNAFTKKVYGGSENTSQVMLVMNGDFTYNADERYKLNALNQILRFRLTEQLREEKGGVYSPYSYQQINQYPNPTYSVNVVFGCDPDRVPELVSTVKDIVTSLQKDLPSDDDMKKVHEADTRLLEKSMKENNYWMSSLRAAYYNNYDPKEILAAQKRVDSITKEDIRNLAKKYLKMDSFKEFILYPVKN